MSLQLNLTVATLTLFHSTDINTSVLNSNGSLYLTHERDTMPDFMRGMQQSLYPYLIAEASRFYGECCLFTDEMSLSYLAKHIELPEQDPKTIVIGPFLEQVPGTNRHDHGFKLGAQQQIELEAYYRSLKLISSSRVQSIANVLDQVGSIRQTPLRIVNATNIENGSPRLSQAELLKRQSDESFVELIELRYQIEKEMMRAVEKGDQSELKRITKQVNNLFDFSERFPNQPVRALKNAMVVLNTLLRIAAERGHVQPIFLHRISEKFSKQIERLDTIDSLSALWSTMAGEYCELVRRRSIAGYSPAVQKAAEHIATRFNRPLNMQELAALCEVHPAHLSRQFKKETGLTLTDFQQKRRMEEAKLLLKSEHVSVGWIAGYVGYEDSGYFTRIFKKLEGMSPSQYRTEQ
ncbi:AraC family transcriptional regulator [Paenibacillus sp. OAS669]|uniref:AraC family transcriptional regulator n=1 Tax=Paenibacillus sp. OAS669 TaxID=2663821 RepID=UPI00178AADE6|nr:AraC family transcriptional regulator [Paenibacillus sp. OAS669]MBE1445239.1 AraC-like DNA-binding protein [Paenibacillus sp. OAS669]